MRKTGNLEGGHPGQAFDKEERAVGAGAADPALPFVLLLVVEERGFPGRVLPELLEPEGTAEDRVFVAALGDQDRGAGLGVGYTCWLVITGIKHRSVLGGWEVQVFTQLCG